MDQPTETKVRQLLTDEARVLKATYGKRYSTEELREIWRKRLDDEMFREVGHAQDPSADDLTALWIGFEILCNSIYFYDFATVKEYGRRWHQKEERLENISRVKTLAEVFEEEGDEDVLELRLGTLASTIVEMDADDQPF